MDGKYGLERALPAGASTLAMSAAAGEAGAMMAAGFARLGRLGRGADVYEPH
jgi:hypothetical protein